MTIVPTEEVKRLSLGDRVLLGFLTPPIAVVLGLLIFLIHSQDPTTPIGIVAKFVLYEFFFASWLFAVLLFIWVVAQPEWVATVLARARAKAARWVISFFVFAFIAGAFVFVMLQLEK